MYRVLKLVVREILGRRIEGNRKHRKSNRIHKRFTSLSLNFFTVLVCLLIYFIWFRKST